MTLIFSIIFLIYFILVIILISGWEKSIETKSIVKTHRENFITVLIPARNEQVSLINLLDDLKRQNHKAFEVIVVDDHSEDKTLTLVEEYARTDSRFSIQTSRREGKKEALSVGVMAATGAILVTTDADCRVGPNWLRSVDRYFQNPEVKFIFGGVRITENQTFFSKLQALEFCSLIGTGAATLALGHPTMCNGANLAFRKTVFEEVKGYSGNLHIASGDDEFLMRKVAAKYPGGVRFMTSPESIVSTLPQETVKDFIHQRIRWAGKWKYHQGISDWILPVFIFIFHLSVIALLPLTLLSLIFPAFVISVWSVKIVGEFWFLRKVTVFLRVRWNWPSFILWQIVYPFYAVSIGFAAHFQPFQWKGRRLKSIKTKLDTIADND